MKKIIIITSLLALTACNSKDQKFCECLKAGEQLNNFSSTLFNNDITPEMKRKMERLKKEKNDACKDYELMSGDKMLELKKACEND